MRNAKKKTQNHTVSGRGPGRPVLHAVTANQERSVRSRLAKGETTKGIAEALGLHTFAVLRIRRAVNAGR